MISDMACISLENAEIQRFASDWMLRGRTVAELDRRLTRSDDDEGSTPLRNKHYYQLQIYLTNFAIDLVKMQLAKKSPLGFKFLDSILVQNLGPSNVDIDNDDPLNSFVYVPKGPCALLEDIYHHGIAQGVTVSESGESLNSLKIAEDIMAMRVALAAEATAALASLATNSRQYYKMIKVG
jgi:hypothetical protein